MPTNSTIQTLSKKKPLFDETMIFAHLVASIKQIEQLAAKYEKQDISLDTIKQDEEHLNTHLVLINRYLALTMPEDAETIPTPLISEATINQEEKESIHEWLVDTAATIMTTQQVMSSRYSEPHDDAYDSLGSDNDAEAEFYPATKLSTNPHAFLAPPKMTSAAAQEKSAADRNDDENLDYYWNRPM